MIYIKGLLFISLVVVFVISAKTYYSYDVKVFYADHRQPKIITLNIGRYSAYPDKNQILTYKRAVPTFFGELNVIDVEILKSDTFVYLF